MLFNITNRDGQTTLSLIGEDMQEVIADTHPNYVKIRNYLFDNTEHDEEYVFSLVNPATAISDSLAEVTDRLTYHDNNLFFDGSPIHTALGRHILRMIEEGDQDYSRFVKFLINLDDNPSYYCQQAVYTWIEANGLTITEDGNFLGYKAVAQNGHSLTAGPNNYVDGVLYGEPGVSTTVPHEIGTVVSKKRADVDDSRYLACSVGLHVGTKSYAEGFGPRLLTVEVNPADVVSVPDRDLSYKIRVCRYKVVALADPKQYEHTSWDPKKEEADSLDPNSWEFEDNLTDREKKDLAYETKANKTLADHADYFPALRDDLENGEIGHKALARNWSHLTTESSVRRWRKAHGVKVSLLTKIRG